MRTDGLKKEQKQARNKERNTCRETKERESEENNGRTKCRETRDMVNPAPSFSVPEHDSAGFLHTAADGTVYTGY